MKTDEKHKHKNSTLICLSTC